MIESGVDLGDVFDVAEDTIKGTTREEVVEEPRTCESTLSARRR